MLKLILNQIHFSWWSAKLYCCLGAGFGNLMTNGLSTVLCQRVLVRPSMALLGPSVSANWPEGMRANACTSMEPWLPKLQKLKTKPFNWLPIFEHRILTMKGGICWVDELSRLSILWPRCHLDSQPRLLPNPAPYPHGATAAAPGQHHSPYHRRGLWSPQNGRIWNLSSVKTSQLWSSDVLGDLEKL